jgi:dTDP-4-amino-4,6-dideoxygalactose transaminase
VDLITDRTSAILPVHVYGTPCDVEKIDAIAKRHNLKVLYDAAHAFGVTINGLGIGNFGDMSMFSFHATKVFNTVEGGALTYNDSSYERAVYLRQNFGIANAEEVILPSTNAKMNEIQSLVGL